MPYLEIQRMKHYSPLMPDNLIRVNKKSLAISSNIAEKFQANRHTTETGRERVPIGIAVDTDTNSIKLLPQATSGFMFGTGSKSSGYTPLYCAKPAGFRRSGLPIGDYQLVDEAKLEFKLAI